MNPTSYINRMAAPWLLLWAIALVMLSACADEQPKPQFEPWTWSECLPSAMPNPGECEGEKPSWQLYQQTGRIWWRYALDGPRVAWTDEHGQRWTIYHRAYCLNAQNDTVGTLVRVGFMRMSLRPDAISGALPRFDDAGLLPGEIINIEGVISLDGRVVPLGW